MTTDLVVILFLLAAAIAMFIVGRPRMDAVALIMIAVMPFTGIITMNEALAGFADFNIVLIAALFVIGEGLVRTGVARRLGDWLNASAGSSETRLVVLLMLVVGGLGSLMSSTAVVAIFIPVVLRICSTTGTPPSRLMMPLSVAALISGMMTLVATAPNLVVNAELARHGMEGFRFFSFTPFGLPVLILGIIYMVVARRMLSSEPENDFREPTPEPANVDRSISACRPGIPGTREIRSPTVGEAPRGAALASVRHEHRGNRPQPHTRNRDDPPCCPDGASG